MLTKYLQKTMIVLSLVFVFIACGKDDYFTQVFDKEQIEKNVTCLKLELPKYSLNEKQTLDKLYNFTKNCDNTLKVSFKSNILCNSEHNTNSSYHAYLQLELLHKDILVYSVYKDLKNEDMNQEIIKGYEKLCQTIKL